ncbi:MAG: hypothetical protein VB089_18550 [Anaerolineaceae bacterium]|nr:hypothetical protein [Anaerolineaceae bacterium]
MPRSHYQFLEDDAAPYFITATVINWLPLFSNPEIVQNLFDSLQYLIDNDSLRLHAWVILENHLHLIAGAPQLSQALSRFKSFTARKSIDYYKERNNIFVLHQLAIHNGDNKPGRDYQFWQEGVHPQRIKDSQMMTQKITYIHKNPVRRGYVDVPEDWRYSSARDYAGTPGLLPVDLEW